jgi:hypothetical protein
MNKVGGIKKDKFWNKPKIEVIKIVVTAGGIQASDESGASYHS